MKRVSIKNVKFYESMSEETNCFQCDVYLDGKKVASAKNSGRGGCTDTYNIGEYSDFKALEDYCSSLPKTRIEGIDKDFDCNLESVVDQLFEDWLEVKYQKKMEKDFIKGLCVGTKSYYNLYTWKGLDIPKLLSHSKGHEMLRKNILEFQGKGETVLNTNIPKELFS